MLTAFVYFRPEELQWTTDAEGQHTASLDLATATFDQDGTALGAVDTTFALHLCEQDYSVASQKGTCIRGEARGLQARAVLVRAALRDPATEKAGSAEEYVEVPDVNNGRLTLSGMMLAGFPVPALPGFPRRRPSRWTSRAGRRGARSGAAPRWITTTRFSTRRTPDGTSTGGGDAPLSTMARR